MSCSHSKELMVIAILVKLTQANWCRRLKSCRVGIHLCARCCCISDQLKAQITRIGSSVTSGVASKCHHAIDNVNRIRTQCCRENSIQIIQLTHSKQTHTVIEAYL